MGRATKWAAGAAGALIPLLWASPAAAAQVSDEDTVAPITFTNGSGGSVTCDGIHAVHTVDPDTGELEVQLDIGGPTACRGTIFIGVQYEDEDGGTFASATWRETVGGSLSLLDAGSSKVTVDYRVEFDNCSNCTYELQTTTK